MAPQTWRWPPPRDAASDHLKGVQLGSEPLSDSAISPKTQDSAARDRLLLSLDFIGEAGEHLTLAGMAICAAAAAENVPALDMALRHARQILLDAISEFRRIAPRSDQIAAAAREYHKSRGGPR